NIAEPVWVSTCSDPLQAEAVSIWGDYIYVSDYASYSLRIIDVSDPSAPFQTGSCGTSGRARDAVVVDDYAYVAANEAGLRVIDVSDPADPVEVGSCSSPSYARGVDVQGDYAYYVDGIYLKIADVSNPSNPVALGQCALVGTASDVASETSTTLRPSSSEGLRVVDVSDPGSPVEVGSCGMPSSAMAVDISAGYAYVAVGYGGLRVVDISDPSNPFHSGYYQGGGISVEELAVVGDTAFTACWSDGLQIYCLGETSVHGSDEQGDGLLRVTPNPSGGSPMISFELSCSANVTLLVYDAAGRLVACPMSGAAAAGAHSTGLGDLPAGCYVVALRVGGPQRSVDTRKFVVLD
ncbi:MAG: hypothetical protein ACQETZ_10950, partial [Candidatus Fermentibacterota bacterium]